jgi:hypothetical protein
LWHGAVIEFGEAEGGLAEFTVFLLGMREPFFQTLLVDKLDAPTAFARIVEGLTGGGFTTTYSTIFLGIFVDGWSVSNAVKRDGPGVVKVEGHVGSGGGMPGGKRGRRKPGA